MAQRYRDLRGDSLARTLFLQLSRHDCQLLLQFRHLLSSITSFVGAGWGQNIERGAGRRPGGDIVLRRVCARASLFL